MGVDLKQVLKRWDLVKTLQKTLKGINGSRVIYNKCSYIIPENEDEPRKCGTSLEASLSGCRVIMVIFLAVSSTTCKTCQSNTIHSEATGFYNTTNNVIAEDAEKMFWAK